MGAKKPGESTTALPPMSVARVADCMRLVEDLVAENIDLFGKNIARHREARRESSTRPLTGQEAAAVAAGLNIDPMAEGAAERIADIQKSGLTAVDEVPMQEVLLAAGVSTAPAAIDAAMRMVALVEMDAETYKSAREGDKLRQAIDDGAAEFGDLEAAEGRERASRALDHFQRAAGVDSGEARSLILRTVLDALGQAMENAPKLGSTLASLIGSQEPTDGTEE